MSKFLKGVLFGIAITLAFQSFGPRLLSPLGGDVLAEANGQVVLTGDIIGHAAIMDYHLVKLRIDSLDRTVYVLPRYHYTRSERVRMRLLPVTVLEFNDLGVWIYEDIGPA
jgi:hypothetical protein